jgi:hypothetical protein
MKISQEKFQEAIKWSPYYPKRHEKQIEILESKARLRVVDAGRGSGKTAVAAYEILRELMIDDRQICLVAPSYGLTNRVMEYLEKWIATGFPNLLSGISKRPIPKIITPWGSSLECKSATEPIGILGKRYDLMVVDEASRVPKDVYETYIFPTTSSGGRELFISTPYGKNWFHSKWIQAREGNGAWKFYSKENPYFEESEWERARNILPDAIFRQEYMAEFIEGAASVFRKVRDCIDGTLEPFNPKHTYLMGVDLGRYRDFTVITVVDQTTRHLVYFDRFNEIDWEFQKARIESVANEYGKCQIWVDATAITVGDAYVQQLSDSGFKVSGYKIGGNIAKRQLIEKLSILIDQKKISFPEIDVLIDELDNFAYELLPSGAIRYQAPEGQYDDCVLSLCLACWELREFDYEELVVEPKEEKYGEQEEILHIEQFIDNPESKQHWLQN